MFVYPEIDPIIFQIGFVKVRWYGLMYVIAFLTAWWLAKRRCEAADSPLKPDQVDDLIFNGMIGVIVGGRVGYALGAAAYLTKPIDRRRLVQIMQLRAQSLARLVEPAREELAEYLARHEERYIHPARVRVTHVYLSRDRRGDALERDATALRDRLNAESIRPDGAATHGDPFLYPADLPPRSEREFTKTFGPMFAAEVIELVPEPPDWRGPFESAYGMHVVWGHERTEARLPALEEVERELREAVFEEKGREELRRTTEELRRSYTVQRADEPGEQAG